MKYEYLALAWRTQKALDDAQYVTERRELDCQGWEVYQLAAWTKGRGGGVTIMRRPKDEPRNWTRCWNCGYVEFQPLMYTEREVHKAPVATDGPRPTLVSKDEPRMWTEGEIQEIAKGTKGSVLNERVMQVDLIGRLERRNEELQAAIDEVVDAERHPPGGDLPLAPVPRHYLVMRTAIRKHLSPLATKEESNG